MSGIPIQPVVEGNYPCIYKYAIRLSRNNWIDLSSFKSLKKNKRVFSIFRWRIAQTIKFGIGRPITASGWSLWLTYKDRKWEKSSDTIDSSFGFVGAPLLPMHLFFKTTEEFKEWLGDATIESLFSELL
jgi:hypothetical protein